MPNHVQLPVVITPTRAELGARCHRRHFLSDVLCRASYSAASLEFGSLIHAAVSAHWLGRDWVSVVHTEWTKRFEQTDVSQESVSRQMAMAMMEHYVQYAELAGPYQNAADDWKLVDAEQRFEIPLGDHVLSFQCDRTVYSSEQNWLLIGDSKTASRLDWRWDRQWETSIQMKLYKLGGQTVFQTGGRVDVFVEGIHKHVPSNIRYYACPDWSQGLLDEAAMNARGVASADEHVILNRPGAECDLAGVEEAAVRYTATNYMDCFSYGVECPFRKICTADVGERVGILRGEFFEKTEEDY